MFKLKGFTLAEVLVTLGIVGVIAALTIPSLQANVKKQQIGPALAKAINTLENANKMYLADKNLKSLWPTCGANYAICLESYVAGTRNNYTLTSKDGITYIVWLDSASEKAPSKYHGDYMRVTIDINGENSGSNKYGEDRFLVYVDGYGQVIPYGGMQYKEYTGEESVLWKTQCPDNGTPTETMACAGAIVDNGYKAKYKL
jgi:prepilin-type N-terminal cleavage/methylation domain-containing protein